MTERLTAEDRAEKLPPLVARGWRLEHDGEALAKVFEFPNFVAAFGWMTRVALWAEKWNHHPSWRNEFGRVEVLLTTHEAEGLTRRDLRLAAMMDHLSESA